VRRASIYLKTREQRSAHLLSCFAALVAARAFSLRDRPPTALLRKLEVICLSLQDFLVMFSSPPVRCSGWTIHWQGAQSDSEYLYGSTVYQVCSASFLLAMSPCQLVAPYPGRAKDRRFEQHGCVLAGLQPRRHLLAGLCSLLVLCAPRSWYMCDTPLAVRAASQAQMSAAVAAAQNSDVIILGIGE
jgi:hypothetical protein